MRQSTADGARWGVRVASEGDRGRFDAFVRGSPRGNPLQLWSWGELKRGDGWQPLRVLVEREGTVRAAISLVERPLMRGRSLWLAHRGPVCEPGEARPLWAGLRRLAVARGAVALRCDPEWPQAEGSFLRRAGLRGLPPRPWYLGAMEPLRVWRIRLAGGEAAVFARFDAHTRQDVRRSGRKGVTLRVAGRDDLPAFYALERALAARRGFPVRSLGFFGRLWSAWNEAGDGRLFVSEHQGRIVGGAWWVICGSGCWGQFVATDPGARRLLPATALYWAGIRWAIARGCTFCDFGGIGWREGVPDGLRDFKKGFGPGDVRFAGEHDLVFRPVAYRAFRVAEEARWAWLGRRRVRVHRAREERAS